MCTKGSGPSRRAQAGHNGQEAGQGWDTKGRRAPQGGARTGPWGALESFTTGTRAVQPGGRVGGVSYL